MADEIASVGVKFDTTDIERGNASLDVLAAKGEKVEASLAKVESAGKSAGKSISTLGGASSAGIGSVGPAADKAAGGMERLGQASRTASTAIGEQAASIKASVSATEGLARASDGAGRSFSFAGSAAATFVGAFSVAALAGIAKSFLSIADAATNVSTQLRLAEGSTLGAAESYERLFDVAQRSRVSFTELANTYAQIRRATQGLGLSASDTLKVTETLGKAITISGVSAQSAQAAMIQLSQGLASGTLRGEELNSIMEQTPRVARALADGLGVSIGKLREMGQAGQLTGDRVTQAILKASESVEREFAQAATTASQAATVLGNSVVNMVKTLDDSSGASGAAAFALKGLSGAIDSVTDAMRRRNDFMVQNPELGGFGSNFLAAISKEYRDNQEAARLARELAPNTAIEGRRAQDAKDALDAANRMQEAVDKFTSASTNMTRAEQKQSAQTKLLTEFSAAVKGYAQDSQQYIAAYKALQTGLANVDTRFKPRAVQKVSDGAAVREARALADAQSKAIGLTRDYSETLRRYQVLRDSTSISEEQYVDAVTKLIQAQPFAIDLARQHADETKRMESAEVALTKIRKDSWDQQRKALATTEELIARLRDEESGYSMTAEAIARRTLQRELDNDAAEIARLAALYELQLSPQQVEAIDEQIAALKMLSAQKIATAGAASDAGVREANGQAASDAAREWERTAGQIEQALANALMDGGKSGLDYIKGIFRTAVLQPLLRPVANTITGVVNGLIGGPTPGGGLGGLGQIGSTISGANSLVSGASTAGAYLSTIFSPVATDIGVNAAIAGGMDAAIAAGAAEGVAAGSAAAAGAGSVLSTLATAAPYLAAAAVVITALMKEGGGPKSGGSAVSTIAGGVMTQAERDARLYTPNGSDASLAQTTLELARSVDTLAQRFGGSAADVRFGLGFDTDPLGTAPNRISAFAGDFSVTNRDLGRDAGSIERGIAEELIRLTLAGLQASNLTGGFAELFDRLDPETAAPDAINNLIALAESLRALGEQAKYLPGALGQVATLSATARESLVTLAGGIDALLQNQATFAQNFLSPTERLTANEAGVGAEFKRITGSDLSTITEGKTAQEIRDAFKNLVLGIDLTSEHGAAAYTALLALNGPMAQLISDLDDLGRTVPSVETQMAELEREFGSFGVEAETTGERIARLTGEIESMEDSLASILRTAERTPLERLADTVAQRDNLVGVRGEIADTIQAQTVQGFRNRGDTAGAVDFLKGVEGTLWQQLGTAMDDGTVASRIVQTFMDRMALEAEAVVNGPNLDSLKTQVQLLEAMQSAAESIRDTLVSLTTGSLSALSPQDQLAASRTAFESTLTAARGGDTDAIANLSGAGRDFLAEAQSFFGSGGDYARIFAQVTGDLEQFAGTFDEAALTAARAQLAGGATGVDNTPQVITGLQAIDTQLAGGVEFLNGSVATQTAEIRAGIAVQAEQLAVLKDESQKAQIRWEELGKQLARIEGTNAELAKKLAIA